MPDAHATQPATANRPSGESVPTDPAATPAPGLACGHALPGKPTATMLAAGARAGNVSVEVAWRVYQAMVTAA